MINEPKRKGEITYEEAWERARFWPKNALVFRDSGQWFHELAREMISWTKVEIQYFARKHRLMYAKVFDQLIEDGVTEDRAAASAFLWVHHHATRGKPYEPPETLIERLKSYEEFRAIFLDEEEEPGDHEAKAYAIVAKLSASDLAPYAKATRDDRPRGVWA